MPIPTSAFVSSSTVRIKVCAGTTAVPSFQFHTKVSDYVQPKTSSTRKCVCEGSGCGKEGEYAAGLRQANLSSYCA
jgi:hypothetical protein